MKKLRQEDESLKKAKKNFQMFEALSRVELNFIRGGEVQNSEKSDNQ